MIALSDLQEKSLPELESLWHKTPLGPRPLGKFRGRFLKWTDSPGSRKLAVRALDYPAFVISPFGIDFDKSAWWFVHPRLAAGRFELREGRSRWRDTEAMQVHYDPSRLPAAIKSMFYDEVKQLSGSLVLGFGGLNAERGEGDHFFFALQRMS
jgi:hypothetical protein